MAFAVAMTSPAQEARIPLSLHAMLDARESSDDESTSKAGDKRSFQPYHAQSVPRRENLQAQASERAGSDAPITTMMLRNIPNKYTQAMLLSLLTDHGFGKSFDFVYLPMDFRNGVNLGYAFVNVATREDAVRLMETFQGYAKWVFESPKVCEVSWAHPHQGLHEHVERYRNSPVMHGCMPDEYKPMLFSAGERVPFPEPTRPIRAPKLRPAREKIAQAEASITAEPPRLAQGA